MTKLDSSERIVIYFFYGCFSKRSVFTKNSFKKKVYIFIEFTCTNCKKQQLHRTVNERLYKKKKKSLLNRKY